MSEVDRETLEAQVTVLQEALHTIAFSEDPVLERALHESGREGRAWQRCREIAIAANLGGQRLIYQKPELPLTAREMFDEANASYEAALAQSRVEQAASAARVARLRHAAELEKLGRYDEAATIIAAVRAEQEAS